MRSNIIDMTGQKFGYLDVIELDENNTKKGAYWKCRCVCGKEKSVSRGNLISGNTTNCGCVTSKHLREIRTENLQGQRFGKLTVKERVDNTKKGAYWLCECDCGNEIVVAANLLKSGSRRHCGCEKKLNFIDVTGQKFNMLTAIEVVEKEGSKKIFWRCKCDCGNETIVESYELRHNGIKSCGCNIHKPSVRRRNLTGKKFGNLTVLCVDEERSRNGLIYWKCKCDCGNYTSVVAGNLRKDGTKSCGCLKRESRNATHGMSKTRLHSEWCRMKERCTPNYKQADGYYERGISVCKEWENDFLSFAEWALQNGYDDKLSLDRVNNDKGYSPDNCRWATTYQQANNKRNNVVLEYNGEKHTAAEWGRIIGIKGNTILERIRNGWSTEEALTKPLHAKRK